MRAEQYLWKSPYKDRFGYNLKLFWTIPLKFSFSIYLVFLCNFRIEIDQLIGFASPVKKLLPGI